MAGQNQSVAGASLGAAARGGNESLGGANANDAAAAASAAISATPANANILGANVTANTSGAPLSAIEMANDSAHGLPSIGGVARWFTNKHEELLHQTKEKEQNLALELLNIRLAEIDMRLADIRDELDRIQQELDDIQDREEGIEEFAHTRRFKRPNGRLSRGIRQICTQYDIDPNDPNQDAVINEALLRNKPNDKTNTPLLERRKRAYISEQTILNNEKSSYTNNPSPSAQPNDTRKSADKENIIPENKKPDKPIVPPPQIYITKPLVSPLKF